jgi:hypothetical protein
MPLCENCGKAIGVVKFCPACGTRTKLDWRALMDQERFESFGSAITETYATGPAHAHPRNLLRKKTVWFTLAACLIAAVFAGLWLRARHQPAMEATAALVVEPSAIVVEPSAIVVAPSPIVARNAAPPPTPRHPRTTPVPTAAPSLAPTNAPTASITPSPPSTASLSLDDAPALVRSNADLAVGKKGSCGGDNVTVDLRGFTRGCTLFGLTSSGLLANGKGTVLIVPVSTTEDIEDVSYGLLYIRSGATAASRFLGVLASDGPGPLVMLVQNGFIIEQNGTRKKSFTFNGHRVVEVNAKPRPRTRRLSR